MKIFELSHLIEDVIKTAREEHVTVQLNNSPFEGVGFPEEILEGMLHQEEGVPSPTETEACRQESLGQHCLIVFGSYGKKCWKFLRGALFSDDTYWLCKEINKKSKIPIDKPWEEDLVIPLTLWCAALTFVCLVAVSYHALFFMVSSIILGLFLLFAIWALIQQRKALRRLSWMLKAERHSRKYLQRKMKVIDIIYAEPLCHVKQAQQPEKVHEKYRPVINYNVNINVDSIQGDIISNGGIKNEIFVHTNKQNKQ